MIFELIEMSLKARDAALTFYGKAQNVMPFVQIQG
jgi:hypothetical protein